MSQITNLTSYCIPILHIIIVFFDIIVWFFIIFWTKLWLKMQMHNAFIASKYDNIMQYRDRPWICDKNPFKIFKNYWFCMGNDWFMIKSNPYPNFTFSILIEQKNNDILLKHSMQQWYLWSKWYEYAIIDIISNQNIQELTILHTKCLFYEWFDWCLYPLYSSLKCK